MIAQFSGSLNSEAVGCATPMNFKGWNLSLIIKLRNNTIKKFNNFEIYETKLSFSKITVDSGGINFSEA